MLYAALKFLEEEGAIAARWQKMTGRGRPRRMYRITPQWQGGEAQKLAQLWSNSTVALGLLQASIDCCTSIPA